MKLWFLLSFNFFVFSFLGGQPPSTPCPGGPRPLYPQARQGEPQQPLSTPCPSLFPSARQGGPQQPPPNQTAPYGPKPYNYGPHEPHPYGGQETYEPHIIYETPDGGIEPPAPQPNGTDFNGADLGERGASYTAARAEAEYWLNLIDQGQYGPSWLGLGILTKNVVTQQQWVAAMAATRKNWKNVVSRKVSAHQIVQTLPYGGSQGNFMVIQYKTSFSNKPGMVETVTLTTEGYLQLWKVISYNIGSY
ncbi:MAG: DUF4019 domain-containing protein [Chlamydiales bacterium]